MDTPREAHILECVAERLSALTNLLPLPGMNFRVSIHQNDGCQGSWGACPQLCEDSWHLLDTVAVATFRYNSNTPIQRAAISRLLPLTDPQLRLERV